MPRQKQWRRSEKIRSEWRERLRTDGGDGAVIDRKRPRDNQMTLTSELLMVAEDFLESYKEETQNTIKLIKEIQADTRAIQALQAQLQEQVKGDIEALTSQCEGEDDSCGSALKEARQEEEQLFQKLTEVEKQNQELSAQCQNSQQNVEKLKEMKNSRLEEKDRLENETMVVLPRRREEISLYQNISRIRFDFEGSQNDVKGYIVNKNDVKPFLFDRSKNSNFFITNALWDLMKEVD